MALNDANGQPPAGEPRDWQAIAEEHDKHVAALIETLQHQLQDERQTLALVEAVVAGFREREKRIARALAALEGEYRGPGRSPEPPTRGRPKAGSKATWTISETKISQTLAALEQIGTDARIQQVADMAGIANETARRALETLRERDQVRITRRDKRYGAHYALMPDAKGQHGA